MVDETKRPFGATAAELHDAVFGGESLEDGPTGRQAMLPEVHTDSSGQPYNMYRHNDHRDSHPFAQVDGHPMTWAD